MFVHVIKVLFFEFDLGVGPLWGIIWGEALHSEDCPKAPGGSPNVWFDAMAALVHATNDPGAFGTDRCTLHAV